jgi:hypothetical protein
MCIMVLFMFMAGNSGVECWFVIPKAASSNLVQLMCIRCIFMKDVEINDVIINSLYWYGENGMNYIDYIYCVDNINCSK